MNVRSETACEATPDLVEPSSGVLGLVLLVLGCAPLLLDQVVPPWGIPAAVASIWLVLRAQGQSLSAVGVRRPPVGWAKTILVGVGGAALMLGLGQWVYPFLKGLVGVGPQDISSWKSVEGNHALLAMFLTVAWTTAGFGEELIFRGFLMTGIARLVGRKRSAWTAGLILSSILFGLVHLGSGAGGVLSTGMNGAVLAGIYLASGRTIWAAYIAHGLVDTVAFLLIYTGNY